MGVDARDLRRDVGAQSHHAPRELVDHLEGAQLKVVPRPGEERVDVLQERRHDQLVVFREKQIEDLSPKSLDAPGLCRKDVLNVFRQHPLHVLVQRRSSRPTIMDDRPTKRIWPSVIWVILRKVSRQRLGAMKGSTPSKISIRASAMRNVVVHMALLARRGLA